SFSSAVEGIVANRKSWTGVLVAGLLTFAVSARADVKVPVPEGWVDLSPGQPVPKGVSPLLVAEARKQSGVAFAVNPNASPTFPESMAVRVEPTPLAVSADSLRAYVAALPERLRFEALGAKATVTESSVVQVGGVDSLRAVVDLASPARHVRMLEYVIPGGS